jgi:hypothetical protein
MKKENTYYILIYSVCHGLLLFLSNAIYWDGWTLYNVDPKVIMEVAYSAGSPWVGYLRAGINSLSTGFLLYRVIIFLSFLVSGLALNQVLMQMLFIDRIKRIVIVSLFLVLPFNAARVTTITANYTISHVLFFIGLWLLTLYLKKPNLALRCTTLFFFFLSFSTNSFLVFYSLVIAFILYQNRPTMQLKKLISLGRKHFDFICLPLIFWGIKTIFFTPYGVHFGYNSIKLLKLIQTDFQQFVKSLFIITFPPYLELLSVINSIKQFQTIIKQFIQDQFSIILPAYFNVLSAKYWGILVLGVGFFIALLALWNKCKRKNLCTFSELIWFFAGILMLYIGHSESIQAPLFILLGCFLFISISSYRKNNQLQSDNSNEGKFFVIGIIILTLGKLPYLAVGMHPGTSEYWLDWNSRQQLLMGLGTAIMIAYFISIVSRMFNLQKKALIGVYILIIGWGILISTQNYIEYHKDWYKQLALIENFKNQSQIRDNTTFYVRDLTLSLNAKNRNYRFYEYTGILKKAFGDETRFAATEESNLNFQNYKSVLNSAYNLADYKVHQMQILIILKEGEQSLKSLDSYFRFVFWQFFDKKVFIQNIKKLIEVRCVPI